MREMKDSGVKWVGEIPSSWKVYKVKQIANSNSEVLPENYDRGPLPAPDAQDGSRRSCAGR